jgi:acyl-CoA thioester hydrolase
MVERPCTTEIAIRLRDTDPLAHVNNTVYAVYVEQALANYIERVVGVPIEEVPLVTARLEIEYRSQIRRGDDVVVETSVPRLGETSLPLGHRILANDGVAATAQTVQVLLNDDGETPKPIPAAWRERIEAHENEREMDD